MSRPVTILIDGKPYRWRDLVALRKAQLAARKTHEQPLLFAELPEDHRPVHERSVAERYRQPSLFTLLED